MNSDLNKKWPARMKKTSNDPWCSGYIDGANEMHDAFMKVINNKSMNCKHGMPQGQGCLQCQKESRNGI